MRLFTYKGEIFGHLEVDKLLDTRLLALVADACCMIDLGRRHLLLLHRLAHA